MTEQDRDEARTTGHSWDGIREYDKPLPRWWLWTFYATIVWSVAYWLLMPAWPLVSDYTAGLLGYSQRQVVADQIQEAKARQAPYMERIKDATLEEIRADQDLLSFGLAAGGSAYAVNCSQCHGAGAAGGMGFPNLNDDAWLWGGSLDAIITTIQVGIRSDHPDTRLGEMPAFGAQGILDRQQIENVVEYVRSLSGLEHADEKAAQGAALFSEQCSACHGPDGAGNKEIGAPDLTDAIWLYGSDRSALRETIQNGRAGMMPAWEDRLSPETIKLLAVYVHSLGGGR